jgi:pSer/pThr/pTyr-binding forkhead associated (FHA) protein
MTGKKEQGSPEGTVLDPKLACPRLKEGLIPLETGIYLRIESGAGAGQVYTLSAGGVYLIGRENADIVLEDTKTSRKHAEIGLYGPGALTLRDLASTNGTFHNGKRVSGRVKIAHWDLIRIGDTELRFSVVEDSIALQR